ncbi:hypothetical protein JHK87_007234 [Glycine soja]|nr:hypothetical protein JHK87_007234 [Glycine soja]
MTSMGSLHWFNIHRRWFRFRVRERRWNSSSIIYFTVTFTDNYTVLSSNTENHSVVEAMTRSVAKRNDIIREINSIAHTLN